MEKNSANTIPVVMLVGMNNLHSTKNMIIPKVTKINHFCRIIIFILQSIITQITSEITYPIKVASEAPSIPNIGIKK